MAKTIVPFKATAGEPLKIDVTGLDGKAYVIRITVAIFSIAVTGEIVQPPPNAPKGALPVPKFEFQAQLAVDTKLKES